MNQVISIIRDCINSEDRFRFDPDYDQIELIVNIEVQSYFDLLVRIEIIFNFFKES